MSSLSKSKRKELPKRLRKALLEFQKDPNGKKAKELLPVLNAFNETMNDSLAICQENFGYFWGQKLANTLRALHDVKYNQAATAPEEDECSPEIHCHHGNCHHDF